MPDLLKSPKPNADRLEDIDDEPKTDPRAYLDPAFIAEKFKQERQRAAKEAKFGGLVWGAGFIVIAVGIAFGVFFKLEQHAAEMDEKVLERADAGVDRKLAPVITDIAVMKNDVATLKDDVADIKRKQESDAASAKARDDEILRLLRKRDRER